MYKLRCRIISCKIAKELYVRGIKSDIVDGWKRISENKNEFIEIRNVVFDTTGDEVNIIVELLYCMTNDMTS